jgi:hypothetical protein
LVKDNALKDLGKVTEVRNRAVVGRRGRSLEGEREREKESASALERRALGKMLRNESRERGGEAT